MPLHDPLFFSPDVIPLQLLRYSDLISLHANSWWTLFGHSIPLCSRTLSFFPLLLPCPTTSPSTRSSPPHIVSTNLHQSPSIILRTSFSGTQLYPHISNMYAPGLVGPIAPSSVFFPISITFLYQSLPNKIRQERRFFLASSFIYSKLLGSYVLHGLWCTHRFFIVQRYSTHASKLP